LNRRLRAFLSAGALAAAWPTYLQAQSPTADRRLEAYVALAQFASPYAGGVFPDQWCYYTTTDVSYTRWYVEDPRSGRLTPLEVRRAFSVPFMTNPYGAQTTAAILVGYVVDGGPPGPDLSAVSFATNPAECSIGLRVLTNGPYPIAELATDIALQTAADPAHEYRVWQAGRQYHHVRLISAIPVSFQVDRTKVAGRVLLGFSGDW
jgi:hypothetical protein